MTPENKLDPLKGGIKDTLESLFRLVKAACMPIYEMWMRAY